MHDDSNELGDEGMNFELDQESQRLLGAFQRLRMEKAAPRALQHDQEAAFPIENFQDLHAQKLLEL